MSKINIKINNIPYEVKAGSTVLEACREAGINIPTLCYLKDINAIGACRVCVVEVKGARSLVASCIYPVNEGMEIITNSKRVIDGRRTTIELMMSDHEKRCLSCARSQNCELQKLSLELNCDGDAYKGYHKKKDKEFSEALVRDNNKCILCRRCVAICEKVQGVGVIGPNDRGFDTNIGCAFDMPLPNTTCVNCGQCVVACPTGALIERDETENVIAALADPTKTVIMATAPAVRVAIGEEFGMPIGTNSEGKMITALRSLGSKYVFDVNFGADLTIIEEGHEFLDRFKNGGVLPMITSCSPAWIKYCEHNFPDLLPHLSSCKSPQQMFGAAAKTYFAAKMHIDPKDLYVVSVMPCTAKKFEKEREYQNASGYPDVDCVITTRELAKLIKRSGILYDRLADGTFDAPFGISTGAGAIFGASGGVMEAALRTVADVLTGKDLEAEDYLEVRGMNGVKEASYNIGGTTVKVGVVNGLANAGALMKKIKSGECDYQFIEVMSCPGGCVNGGGQPIHDSFTVRDIDVKGLRAKALYRIDGKKEIRKSHKNPAIIKIYEEFFGTPNSEKAHHILHTKYVARDKF